MKGTRHLCGWQQQEGNITFDEAFMEETPTHLADVGRSLKTP